MIDAPSKRTNVALPRPVSLTEVKGWSGHQLRQSTHQDASDRSQFFVSQQQEKVAVRQCTHLQTESCGLLGNSRQINRKNAAAARHVTDT
jgi:hypothetical protein